MPRVLLAPNGAHGSYIVADRGRLRVIDLLPACKGCPWGQECRCKGKRAKTVCSCEHPWRDELGYCGHCGKQLLGRAHAIVA